MEKESGDNDWTNLEDMLEQCLDRCNQLERKFGNGFDKCDGLEKKFSDGFDSLNKAILNMSRQTSSMVNKVYSQTPGSGNRTTVIGEISKDYFHGKGSSRKIRD